MSPQIEVHHNLATQPTTFIGREEEIAEIIALLGDSSCRLLSITGPGGIGKTRLAIEIALRVADDFSDGAYFVSLQSVNSVDQIPHRVANALDLHFHGREPKQEIIDYLRDKNILILMDNYEHLISGADLIIDTLSRTSKVKFIATSRESLKVRGEQLYPLQGMEYPENRLNLDGREYNAIKLFKALARRGNIHFSLAEDLDSVITICQLTEGMPLALELAAAWTQTLTPGEIAENINEGIRFLEAPIQDLPARHRSMQAVFDHSWRMLKQNERQAFRKLSIFKDGFTLDAAETVAKADLTTLQSLINQSIIQRDQANRRFHMHELVRKYGEEKLYDIPEERSRTRDRFISYYAKLADRFNDMLFAEINITIVEKVNLEIGNINSAIRLSLRNSNFEFLGKYARLIAYYCQALGLHQFGARILEGIAASLREQPRELKRDRALGTVLTFSGWTVHVQAHNDRAVLLLEESLGLLEDPASISERAYTLAFLGRTNRALGRFEQAKKLLDEALDNFKQVENRQGVWMSLGYLGETSIDQGEYNQSCALSRAGAADV